MRNTRPIWLGRIQGFVLALKQRVMWGENPPVSNRDCNDDDEDDWDDDGNDDGNDGDDDDHHGVCVCE